MMKITTMKLERSVHARWSVEMIMFSLELRRIRCHIFIVDNKTRKAMIYPSTESAAAVS